MPDRLVSTINRAEVQAVVALMESFPRPWFVCGGWSIDLLANEVTREHEDLEIAIARHDQVRLHSHLAGWQLCKLVKGQPVLWQPDEWLEPSVHQIVAQRPEATPPEFEFLLNDVTDGEWQFRRDPRIRRPFKEIYLRTPQGIPVSAPEIQLLFKASWHQLKDEHDFRTALPHLAPDQRSWLRQALEVYRPGDPWLDELT